MDGRLARLRADLVPARTPGDRPDVIGAVAAGVAAFIVFLAAYLAARHLPVVGAALHGVLATADAGSITVVLLVALVNGAGEELFFRGALHAAVERHRPALVYVVVTAATGNIALVIAAVVMGALFSVERLSSRGVLAPMLTHLTWTS